MMPVNRNAINATQFCGSAIVNVRTGGRKKKLKQRTAARDAAVDSAILALRLDEGLDLAAYESRFGTVARDRVDGALRGLDGTGLLVRRGENVALSDKGRFVANEVFIRLL